MKLHEEEKVMLKATACFVAVIVVGIWIISKIKLVPYILNQ